ncbi:hypothetical protein TraAM80_04548 [Trypanosoma rangeli]|uniref:Uncharacterized protein n=1 Tax=Trypanosoma rangeli TaxID=5698 RepID=A0A3R7NEV3_TRYRA|nr:uncharacterized protein TraAM80_04548 [Trypanosoma rangeli]RNF05447.1 hypothetical protein TraAM80_04548 [Trypanosoma rangeli]|eukprot:RNF05447.1 hypothetical protein TraAM80_04548 [Trypanosoma rangeli]
MRGDSVWRSSVDHTTWEHGQVGGFTAPSAAPRIRCAGQERALVTTKANRDRGVPRQQVCWQSVGKRPGIPEVIDGPLTEPWVPPSEAQLLICSRSKGCPCLSCEKRRRCQKFGCVPRMGRSQ